MDEWVGGWRHSISFFSTSTVFSCLPYSLSSLPLLFCSHSLTVLMLEQALIRGSANCPLSFVLPILG